MSKEYLEFIENKRHSIGNFDLTRCGITTLHLIFKNTPTFKTCRC
jgi:hypothetical protein